MPGAESPQRAAAEGGPEVMAHGYTQRTTRTGDVVMKIYQGPEAGLAEPVLAGSGRMLRQIHELPVPTVLSDGCRCHQARSRPS